MTPWTAAISKVFFRLNKHFSNPFILSGAFLRLYTSPDLSLGYFSTLPNMESIRKLRRYFYGYQHRAYY
jgi:hypothetical protein